MLGEFADVMTQGLTPREMREDEGVEEDSHDEPEDEGGDDLVPGFLLSLSPTQLALEEERGDDSDDYDPESSGELDGGGHLLGCIGTIADDAVVCTTRTDYRRGVMDGDGCPGAELLLAHIEVMAKWWEDEESNGIENKDNAQCHRHRLGFGLDDWTNGSDGRSATDSGAR